MRFSALGDVAMMVPVVSELARQYPRLRIAVLSKPFAAAFFDDLAPNVTFMSADFKKEYLGIKGLNKLFRRLIAKNFTVVADFHDELRTKYLRTRFTLGGFKVKHINKHRLDKKALVSEHNRRLVQLPTEIECYCEVLSRLGYPVQLNFQSIFPPEGGDISFLARQLGAKGDDPWIGVAPFAAHQGKVYPVEKMEEAIARLGRSHTSARIFLFGGSGRERKLLDAMAERHKQCMSVSKLVHGLKKELALMSHLDVMISMDSANMQLASLVGTPVVSVWGSTHPYAGYMGYGQSASLAVQKELQCRPCSVFGCKKCKQGNFACLNDITPDDIINKVEQVLATGATKG